MSIHAELQGFCDAMVRAYRAGDAAGCAALFTEDASLLSPWAPPTFGRTAIEALHRDWVQGGEAKTIDIVEYGASGDLAWCLARFAEGEATGEGTSLIVFTRTIGGPWLIRQCSLNQAQA